MSERRSFATVDLSAVPPLEFELGGEVFRVPRKQRHDIMVYVAQNTIEVAGGERGVKTDACRQAILLFLARELYDPEAPGEPLDPQPTADDYALGVLDAVQNADGLWCTKGAWVQVDDYVRFSTLTNSPRVAIPDDTYGDLLDYIVTEVTAHPTGARS